MRNEQLLLGRAADILVVEDNEDDFIIMRETFKRDRLMANLFLVENGEECLDYLNKRSGYENVLTPDLIILDLNMPVMDGRELLGIIRKDQRLSQIPVVVLSTSDSEDDIAAVQALGVAAYMNKPVDFEELLRAIQSTKKYWFTLVVLAEEQKEDMDLAPLPLLDGE